MSVMLGEAELTLSAGMEAHLRDCPDCRSLHQRELQLENWLSLAGELELDPPDSVWEGIQKRMTAPEPVWVWLLKGFRTPQLRTATASFVILLIGSLALILSVGPTREESLRLADLETFKMAVSGNPFLLEMERSGLFTGMGSDLDNPFERAVTSR